MRCLVVDDSAAMRRIVVKALAHVGIEAVEAADGSTAIAACTLGMDVVITDWRMASMSGLELVKRLRAAASTARVPILMMTADRFRNDLLEALEAGVTGFIVKPFTAEDLRDKIDQAVALTSGSV